MPKVRIQSDKVEARLIDLREGSNRIGRSSSNDIQIEHSSISSCHCEIFVQNSLVEIRDLGSTNGTFVDGVRVEKAALKDGQRLRLGIVDFIVEPELNSAVSTEPAPVSCAQHPGIIASAECATCRKFLCDFCVTTRTVNGEIKKFCRQCRNECALANVSFAATETDDKRALALLTNALRYPIQRHGWVLLLGGSLLLFVLDIAIAGLSLGTPATAAFALVFGVLAGGYLFAFMQRIISSTTLGEEKMPGWPDFTEVYQDMIQPFRLAWGLFAFCFSPALVCWYFAHHGSQIAEKILLPLLIAGFLYLPMALLAVAISDSLASMNPLFIIGSICKVPAQYVIACLLMIFVLALKWSLEIGMQKVIPNVAIRYLISAPLLLYFLIVEMRVLGLLYLWNRRKLGWL